MNTKAILLSASALLLGLTLGQGSLAAAPANDLIADSITVAPPSDTPMTVAGTTLDATDDVAEAGTSFCGTSLTSGGVWYDFVADGPIAGTITATTCSDATTYDSKISVFKGTPGSLECIGGNDDDTSCTSGIFDSTFAWPATAGENYYVLVHGFGSAQGPFELTLDASGSGAEARIVVSKTWSDSPNSTPVTVNLSCNDGFVSQDGTAEISEGNPHTFVITNLFSTDVNCEVSEVSVSNYTQTYNANSGQATSCVFDADPVTGEALLQAVNTCEISNTAEDATYTVTKDWMITGAGGNAVEEEVYVTIECTAPIDQVPAPLVVCAGPSCGFTKSAWLGDGDTLVASVSTLRGDAMCKAYEDIVQSGVESTNGCASYTTLSAGEKYGCTITNTIFFEGIPTLNQYGMAIMALLMLGLGFVGFRRFV